jgi:hypothetical protein
VLVLFSQLEKLDPTPFSLEGPKADLRDICRILDRSRYPGSVTKVMVKQETLGGEL